MIAPALLLAALTATAEPPQGAHMAPPCFGPVTETALYLGSGWDEALVSIVPDDGDFRLTFRGPLTWTEVIGQPGRFCITAYGDAL